MAFDDETLRLLKESLGSLEIGFKDLPSFKSNCDLNRLRPALLAAAERMRDNFPYHHPLYVGQMLKPPHPVARLAYALAMFINPNNHALDGGRASSAMEKESVAQIARMFGWEMHLGHLTGGGTMANFEALWIARELRPGRAIAASAQAHYTHARLSSVLGVPFVSIPIDARGRMDIKALEDELKRGQVGTVVVTLGTTAAGAVDPLPQILALRDRFDVRVHVDAAYGGYFTLASNLETDARRAFERISDADSIVIDPHKHGLQPYGCGCVLFGDPSVGRFYKHDSPYTYFSSDDLHLGEISLECSRPGAAAVALWTTMKLLPLDLGGEFAQMLESCRGAALALHDALARDARFAPLVRPELDIVTSAVRAESATRSSQLAREIFAAAARKDLHLALATFPRPMVEPTAAIREWDSESVTCLRACVMKPEHRQWMPEILSRLRAASNEVP
jgi:glutamate/tyrosine decarboxylase-like PLP-dependent enzyme